MLPVLETESEKCLNNLCFALKNNKPYSTLTENI